ncbi:phage tail spike protein [Streptococcus oralis]|uniref:Phage minor structural protein, N-terminal domain protein n=1 Tax=Streptococcus mitis bv. 2 str. F0392 TaxID=768726 RepID=F9P1N0_STROR|nr:MULTISPECIES: phage tail spike protein [Streptococcus]EGR93479.1 phage minor structural protein, N-terminal domain protein [Streptococcus mitis bv. 2 str. F0392]
MIYLTNGNTPLNAAYEDKIVQEDGSTYQLTFRFPTSDSLWEKLKEETFLTADDLHGEQDFVIFEVEKKHGYIQVYANQVFTLLNNYVVNPISLDRATGSTALSRFAGSITRSHPFSFFSDIGERHTFNIDAKNAMEAFVKDKHSILGQWGGDLVRHSYQVRLLKNGGSENESLFMYKKNLSSYQHKTSTKSLKTRITFKTTVKGEGEKAPDRKFSVVVDSPLINKYSQIYEDVIEVNDEDVKDEASLRKYGEQYFKTSLCDMMEDSLELEVVGQSDVPVQMYDIVSLFHEVYNLDVRKKITKYTYSPMANKLLSIGFGQFKSGLSNMVSNAVSDAVKNEAQQLQDDFERQLARELKNADLAFDRQKEELVNQFTDGLNAAKARAEEVKRELSDTIDQRFNSFNNGPLQEVKRRTEEALKNSGASSLLAQEAKRIGLDSVARLEAFKSQATSAQTALSGDLDVLKRTVANEVNQASEYRKTTTEALSRMTGQMNGFATKSEVKQDIDGLTQTFAKMMVGGRNYYRNSDKLVTRPRFIQFDVYPYLDADNVGQDWTFSFDLKINETGTVRPLHFYHYQRNGLAIGIDTFFNPSKEWQRYSFTGKVVQGGSNPAYAKGAMAIYDHAGDNNISIQNIKFERGTVATPWSPAPEDGEDELLAVKTEFKKTADGLSAKIVSIESYVAQDGQRQEALRRYSREESAKQATSLRELVTRDFVGKATHQEDVRAIERRFETITNPQNGSIATQIANYKTAVDGRFSDITSLIAGKANQTDFQRVKETSQLYERILGNSENGIADKVARMAMTNQLFQVEVGKAVQKGRNYYRDSEKVQTKTRFFSFPLHPYLSQENVGETWTLSFDLKINEGGEIRPLHFYHYQTNRFGIKASADITPSKDWQRFTFTGPVIFPNDDPRYARGEMALYDFGGNNNYSVRRIKFERGTVATPWSPAPEDNDEAIRTVQSQLAGSWGVHNKNSVNEIIAGFNLAGRNAGIKAETIRLEGRTLLDELTAIQGYFKRLFVGEGAFAKLNAEIIASKTITADKLVMDMAMARMFVSSDIFTDTLAAKEAFINKLRSVVVTATLLEGYKGRIGGFQIGTHEKDSSVYWITGENQFSVGMSNGTGQWSQTALWVNWGNNWGYPGDYAWYVKNNGKMYCYNTAEFWNTPVIHGDLRVTGHIFYNNENSGKSGYWIHSSKYSNFEPSNNYLYLYYSGSGYDWIPMNKEISDRRYKHNIEASTVSGIDVIENLKTYSYRKEYDGKIEDISCGIMAQDVQKYAPEAFFENPDGAYSYNTFALVPYLIKAIQELNQKIEKLEKTA